MARVTIYSVIYTLFPFLCDTTRYIQQYTNSKILFYVNNELSLRKKRLTTNYARLGVGYWKIHEV